ncbi:RteC domain-containing protein [Mucilaginibacter gynuensis]|uniref:RteC domain-containing protein n=1 Tax=Mucilaginibacter gynuensis TaxID=1302236 RepID=A0ABP8GKY5_9SPHI
MESILMINEWSRKVFEQMLGELEKRGELASGSLIMLTERINIIRQYLVELRTYLGSYSFESISEEIRFFKETKPMFYSRHIFEVMHARFLKSMPIGTDEQVGRYLDSELIRVNLYFERYSFYYDYYRYGGDELDQVYFLRGPKAAMVYQSEFPELYTDLSTGLDYLFAKFRAYEQLREIILEQISSPGRTNPTKHVEFKGMLKWTGAVVNIVELAYGIWLTGQINNGNVSLNQIVRWLEESLQLKIGIVQRRFTEIESRKRTSQTQYIEQMRKAILEKIHQDSAR